MSGLAHLLAVSGLHTSTWCAYIILFLKLFKVKENDIKYLELTSGNHRKAAHYLYQSRG